MNHKPFGHLLQKGGKRRHRLHRMDNERAPQLFRQCRLDGKNRFLRRLITAQTVQAAFADQRFRRGQQPFVKAVFPTCRRFAGIPGMDAESRHHRMRIFLRQRRHRRPVAFRGCRADHPADARRTGVFDNIRCTVCLIVLQVDMHVGKIHAI